MLNSKKWSASGFYGGTNVNIKLKDGEVTYAIPVQTIDSITISLSVGKTITEDDAWYVLKNGDTVSLFTIENAKMGGTQWALCSVTKERNGGLTNDFVYILAERLDLNSVKDVLPMSLMEIRSDSEHITVDMQTKSGAESLGRVYMVNEDTWLMNPTQVMVNANPGGNGLQFVDNQKDCYEHTLSKYTLVSIYVDSSGNPKTENVFGKTYYIAIYKQKLYYILKDRLDSSDGSTPLVSKYEKAVASGENRKCNMSHENLTMKYPTCGMNSSQVKKDAGSYIENVNSKNYDRLFNEGAKMAMLGWEKINNVKYYILYWALNTILYVRADDVNPTEADLTVNDLIIDTETVVEHKDENKVSQEENLSNIDKAINADNVYSKNIYRNSEPKNSNYVKHMSEGGVETSNGKSRIGQQKTEYYDVTLQSGKYPDEEMNKKTGASYIAQKKQDTLNTNEWSDWETLAQSEDYNLQRYSPTYVDGSLDARQIYKINRFKLMTESSGLSTKSFVFMTKPDLNLYKLDENNNVIQGQMNPDLIRLPEFKYIGRMKNLGSRILDSLEYWGTKSSDTPWLSIITNQAEGYTPVDREIGYTEVGETFHGHKVLYGKHDFKHNIAGTIQIPFMERRDLSLYYTLKIWTEYIHYLNLGIVEPHPTHMLNAELDYAVSLYYIQTDETMENIIYWEKLTGVFPLNCPDSFFEWQKGNPGKDMEYTINFAYSMRSVLRATDLWELDRLYMKGENSATPMQIPVNKEFIYDVKNNPMLSKMVAYFDNIDSVNASFDPKKDQGVDFTIEQRAAELASTGVDMAKFYYEPYTDDTGRTGEYLANWLKDYQIHGVPYVKGPFIVPAKDYSEGKYLMKWV